MSFPEMHALIDKEWSSLVKSEKSISDFKYELELHKKVLQWIQPGESYYFIFSPVTREIEGASVEAEEVLGLKKEELTIERLLQHIHPDDVQRFIDFEKAVVKFKKSLPVDKLDKYKSQYTYRMRTSDNSYIHVLHQSISIQIDEDGSIIRNLIIHTNISNIKDSNKMQLSFIGLEGEQSYLNVPVKHAQTSQEQLLTKREKEILKLFSQCLTSEQISKQLFVSPLTVNTHRKNILRKLNCKTMLEALNKSQAKGWI